MSQFSGPSLARVVKVDRIRERDPHVIPKAAIVTHRRHGAARDARLDGPRLE
jgi:hypothetical protein